MPLTQEQYSTLIVLEVGDTATGAIATNIDLLWTRWDTIADLDLRALFVRRDAIDIAIADVRKQISFKALDGASVDLSDLLEHLLKMREAVEAEIGQAGASAGGGIVVGGLVTTAPIMPDNPFQNDPNDRQYRGDPLRPRGWRP